MATSHAIRDGFDSTESNMGVGRTTSWKKVVALQWVFRYKYVFDSEKPKYKAQLIVKGFKQEHGIDYDEIFSPVVMMTTLQLLLRVVATEDLELEQLDVKTTFYTET